MKNVIIGFGLGVFFSLSLFFGYIALSGDSEFEKGRAQGVLDGKRLVIDKVEPYLPLVNSEKNVDILLSFKTIDLVVYMTEGGRQLGIRK
ncbi:MAG: hypothetical protein BWY02_01822 [bacterium ADurb.Bin157]|nr:hypothetical protein [Candidatus Riflebacteria bacterium]OQB48445.1 MAG: hypothetical protein BWY02_01822 [bacterium ADurb.Bin157]